MIYLIDINDICLYEKRVLVIEADEYLFLWAEEYLFLCYPSIDLFLLMSRLVLVSKGYSICFKSSIGIYF
jgi:hypothetical protein